MVQGCFGVLLEVLGISLGFDSCPHSIIPITRNLEYPPGAELILQAEELSNLQKAVETALPAEHPFGSLFLCMYMEVMFEHTSQGSYMQKFASGHLSDFSGMVFDN